MNNWRDDVKYPVADWRTEVSNDDTRLGYGDWVATKVADEPPGEEPAHGSTADRDRSCQQRIVRQQENREEQYAAWFADLDTLGDFETITLAVAEVDDFHLTDVEQEVLALGEIDTTVEDDVVVDEDGKDSTFSEQWDLMAERAKDAITEMRDDNSLSETVLAVSTTVTMRVELSTGGPADYLTCDLDTSDRSIGGVTYHFANWFDHAERNVDDASPLTSLCEYFAEIVSLTGDE